MMVRTMLASSSQVSLLSVQGDREKLAFTLSSLDDPDPFAECTSIPTGVEDALRQVPACTYAPVSCLPYAGGLLRGVRIK